MTAGEVRTHIRYSGWASRRVLETAMALSVEDQSKPMGVSHESIGKTLTHIYLADRIWYKRTVRPDLDMPAWGEGIPLIQLEEQWANLQAQWEAWADSLNDEDLNQVVPYRMLNGTEAASPLLHIVLHVVNHATLHRGQVVAMLRQVGVKPPVTDLIYYFRELAAAA